MAAGRVVVVAVDGSIHSDNALKCKLYLYSSLLFISLTTQLS